MSFVASSPFKMGAELWSIILKRYGYKFVSLRNTIDFLTVSMQIPSNSQTKGVFLEIFTSRASEYNKEFL